MPRKYGTSTTNTFISNIHKVYLRVALFPPVDTLQTDHVRDTYSQEVSPEVYYTNVVAEWQIDNTMEKFLKVLIAKGNVSTDKLCNVLYWLCLLAVREHRSVHFCWSGAQVKIRKNSNSLCTLCDQCARQIQAHDNCSLLRQEWCGSDHISGAIF